MLLIGAPRRTDEGLAVGRHFLEIAAGLFVGQVRSQLVIDGGWLETVDLVHCCSPVARKGAEHVAGAGIVGRDHAVLALDLMIDRFELVERQDIQIGGSQLNVILRVEQIIA